jgi:hypothetical protein
MKGSYPMEEESALRDGESGGDGGLSRRRLFGVSAVAGLALAGAGGLAACGASKTTPRGGAVSQQAFGRLVAAPSPAEVIGTNINGDPAIMSFAELRDVQATWVRGFYAMPDADKGSIADQPVIAALLSAAGQGYGTVLSLKFPYNNAPIPVPGTPAMATAQRRLDAVLPTVMGKVAILAIGNEPFIECEAADRDSARLNAFYEAMAQRAIAYRAAHPSVGKTQLYMGALNHLDEPAWRTAATERWMAYVRATPQLAGTDIHPHLAAPEAGRSYLDYILPRMRPGQKFLATEFSLVLYYKSHLNDPIAPGFANRYRLPAGTRVYQVIKDALRSPFPQQKWDDFLALSPWFAGNKNFLSGQAEQFRATGKLAVAGYGLGQGDSIPADKFTPETTPWLLVSMFCQRTVQRAGNGLPGQTTAWTNEFRALQHA